MAEAEPAGMRPVFIGGCMRSGTTLLGSVLGGHSQVVCVPEARFIAETYPAYVRERDIFKAWNRFRNHPQFTKQWIFSRQERLAVEARISQATDYRSLVEQLIAVYAIRSGKTGCICWVDHTTNNIMQAPVLLEIFPEARFIHLIRDGRAVANSMLRVRFGPRTTHHAARKWVFEVASNFAVQQIMNQPERFFNIRYEEFIRKSEDSLQAICRFTGIPYEPALTEKQGYAVPANNARSHRLVGQPPDPARISSWQRELSAAEISIFEKQARDMLVLTGYEPVSAPESITPVQKLRWIVLAGLSRRIFKHRASRQARQAAEESSG